MADDILHDFIARLSQWAPAEEVARTEAELRREWGGASLYIKKKDPPETRCRTLGLRLAAGISLADAFGSVGVSRATGYRLLSRRWSAR